MEVGEGMIQKESENKQQILNEIKFRDNIVQEVKPSEKVTKAWMRTSVVEEAHFTRNVGDGCSDAQHV